MASIKRQFPHTIQSSAQGYRCCTEARGKVVPAGSVDRTAKILFMLLKNADTDINLYDLAEELYVSESTIRNDIQKLKKRLPQGSIAVRTRGNCVCLEGSEREKRKYMVSLLYGEGDFKEQLKLSVQNMIGFISLSELEAIIDAELKQREIAVSTYTLYNIVLHFAISMTRIRQGYDLKNGGKGMPVSGTTQNQLSNEIADIISDRYNITFNASERAYLAPLFIGIYHDCGGRSLLHTYVQAETIKKLNDILKHVEATYHIDLNDQTFFVKLAVHVQSLCYRSKYDSSVRNDSMLEIKSAYPLIYDISVYMSSLIQQQFNIRFNDDEISFIALHFGALLEIQRKPQQTVRIALLAENYHSIDQLAKNRLESVLGRQVSILDINEVSAKDYDVRITTSRQVASRQSGSVYIHPLPTQADLARVANRFTSIRRQKWNQEIYGYIDTFIAKNLFFNQIDPVDLTPAELRAQMVERLVKYNYVDEDYFQSVENREAMSPTSFPSGVAVPHSVMLDARKSGVAVATLQEPIQWTDYSVRLVVLVAVSPHGLQAYNAFFEKFIAVLSEPVNTKMLSGVEGFSEFILKLKSLISKEDA